MYDYRLAKGDSRRELNPYQRGLQRPLSPIREKAHAPVAVPPSSKAFSTLTDPDNSILFLDNNARIVNPVNAKTPPPPLWGEVLEEENYDPNEAFYDQERAEAEMLRRKRMEEKRKNFEGKKLKRKVVYVYESDSDQEEEAKRRRHSEVHPRSHQATAQSRQQQSQQRSQQLPQIIKKYSVESAYGISRGAPASRSIRTGGFQKLPLLNV